MIIDKNTQINTSTQVISIYNLDVVREINNRIFFYTVQATVVKRVDIKKIADTADNDVILLIIYIFYTMYEHIAPLGNRTPAAYKSYNL